MSSEDDKRDLTTGPVWRALAKVSAPMTLGILGVLSVGLADAYFLARAGQTELTAIGFVYPVIITITSLSIGLGAGTSSVVSQALGREGDKDGQTSSCLALHALVLSTLLAVIVSLAFWLTAPWIFSLMGAKGKVLDAVLVYVPYWCISFPPMVAGMALNSVFRAGGESHISATVMLSQSLINIALTPTFIFGVGPIPEMGMAGAGLSTLVARVLGFAGLMLFALQTRRLILGTGRMSGFTDSVRSILTVGLPAAASNAINPAGMALVTSAVAVVGDTAVAGFGAATRVQSLLFVPMLALSSGIGPVVGQAWGAQMQDRAQATVRLTFLICLAWGLFLCAAMFLLADHLAALMTDGSEATEFAAQYLRFVSVSFFGYGVLVTANAAINARDKALWSMSLSAARIALVYVPFAWLGAYLVGFSGILAAAVAANLLAAWGGAVACQAVGLLDLETALVRGPAQALRGAMGKTPEAQSPAN